MEDWSGSSLRLNLSTPATPSTTAQTNRTARTPIPQAHVARTSQTQRILRELERLSTPAAAARSMNLGRGGLAQSGAFGTASTTTPGQLRSGRLRGPPTLAHLSQSPYRPRPYSANRSFTASSQLQSSSYPPPPPPQASTSSHAGGGKMARKRGGGTFSAKDIDSTDPLPYNLDSVPPLPIAPAASAAAHHEAPPQPPFLANGIWTAPLDGPLFTFHPPINLSRGPRKVGREEAGLGGGSPVKKEPGLSSESSPNSASSSSVSGGDAETSTGQLKSEGPLKWEEGIAYAQEETSDLTKGKSAKSKPPAYTSTASWNSSESFASKKGKKDSTSASTPKPWTCKECFVPNEATAEACVCCASPNPNSSSSSTSTASKKGKEDSTPAATPKPWTCQECFVPNEATAEACVCCTSANPNSSASTAASKPAAPVNNLASKGLKLTTNDSFSFGVGSGVKAAEEKPTSTASAAPTAKGLSFGLPTNSSAETTSSSSSGSINLFTQAKAAESAKKSGPDWSCTTCFVSNPSSSPSCLCCQSPRPGTSFKPISFAAPTPAPPPPQPSSKSSVEEDKARKTVTFNEDALTETKIITPNPSFTSSTPSFGIPDPSATLPLATSTASLSSSSSSSSAPSASATTLSFPPPPPTSTTVSATFPFPSSAPALDKASTVSTTTSAPTGLFGTPTASAPSLSGPSTTASATSLTTKTTTTPTFGASNGGLFSSPALSSSAAASTGLASIIGGKRTLNETGVAGTESPSSTVTEAEKKDDDERPAKKAFTGLGTSAATETPKLLFGAPAAKAATGTGTGPSALPNLFAPPKDKSGTTLFGSSETASNPLFPTSTEKAPLNLFGGGEAKATTTSGGASLFPATSTPSTGGLFGGSSNAAPSLGGGGAGLFGKASGETGAGIGGGGIGGGLFGTPKAEASAAPAPLFGSVATTSLFAANPFGAPSQQAPAAAAPPPTIPNPFAAGATGNGGFNFPAVSTAPAPAASTGFDFKAAAGGDAGTPRTTFEFGGASSVGGGTGVGGSPFTFGASDGTGNAAVSSTMPPPAPTRKIVRANRRLRR